MLIKPLCIILLFLMYFGTFAQPAEEFTTVQNVAEIRDKIVLASNETNSLSSSFTQEKHLTMMKEVLVSRGNFQFKKENKVRWTYTHPIDYAIIINENQFVILNEGKASTFDISSNKMFSEINQMIVMAIKGNFLDGKDFRASYFESKSFYKIALAPVNEQIAGILSRIEIFYNKKDMSVEKVKFIEPGDDFTQINFTDRKLNTSIPDETFTLK